MNCRVQEGLKSGFVVRIENNVRCVGDKGGMVQGNSKTHYLSIEGSSVAAG